ncbi:MAG: general secretion pathway protein G [Myxococcota bacterium]|jgi:general secretion pathway protein G
MSLNTNLNELAERLEAEQEARMMRGPKDQALFTRAAREGLTLVEIMVVMAILGVLMTVLGGGMLGILQGASVDATKLTMGQVDQGLQIYAAKHKGKFPSTSQGLDAAAKYLRDGKVPQDAWDQDFQYFSPSSHSDAAYDLLSVGDDGQEGTDDDIKSWESGDEE